MLMTKPQEVIENVLANYSETERTIKLRKLQKYLYHQQKTQK